MSSGSFRAGRQREIPKPYCSCAGRTGWGQPRRRQANTLPFGVRDKTERGYGQRRIGRSELDLEKTTIAAHFKLNAAQVRSARGESERVPGGDGTRSEPGADSTRPLKRSACAVPAAPGEITSNSPSERPAAFASVETCQVFSSASDSSGLSKSFSKMLSPAGSMLLFRERRVAHQRESFLPRRGEVSALVHPNPHDQKRHDKG